MTRHGLDCRREGALERLEQRIKEEQQKMTKISDEELKESYQRSIDKKKQERETLLVRLGKKTSQPTYTPESPAV